MNSNIISAADILIPVNDFEKWSVIACDQFSSQPEYWERVAKRAAGAPSALKLIIPEAYLEQTNEKAKASEICLTMKEYLESGVFRELKDSFIYVQRTQTDGRVREGLVCAIDLDSYDFSRNDTPIRASEGTILERLPARIDIRKAASIELPHIIGFIDDKENVVFKILTKMAAKLETLYDFELMEGGGHIKGKRVTGTDAEDVRAALGTIRTNPFIIIGDGNHSLAAAKVYWDELKKNLSGDEQKRHPAGKALIEICNVYDSAIDFEAIHRVLFNIDASAFISEFEKAMPQGSDYIIKWVSEEEKGEIGVKAACIGDMLVLMQDFVDTYIRENPGSVVDYIHGADSVEKLSSEQRRLGLILPAMDKSDFFETVAISGVFPRKSFSVGHAGDKRYYLECRRIISV